MYDRSCSVEYLANYGHWICYVHVEQHKTLDPGVHMVQNWAGGQCSRGDTSHAHRSLWRDPGASLSKCSPKRALIALRVSALAFTLIYHIGGVREWTALEERYPAVSWPSVPSHGRKLKVHGSGDVRGTCCSSYSISPANLDKESASMP